MTTATNTISIRLRRRRRRLRLLLLRLLLLVMLPLLLRLLPARILVRFAVLHDSLPVGLLLGVRPESGQCVQNRCRHRILPLVPVLRTIVDVVTIGLRIGSNVALADF